MNQEKKNKEPRKGFHPALIIATIAVIIFVLWFCPYALMNARIAQTEARAVQIMQNHEFTGQDTSSTKNPDFQKLQTRKKYTDYSFFVSISNPETYYAIPEYYGRTGVNTYCYKDNRLFKKDIKDITITEFNFPLPDDTWKK